MIKLTKTDKPDILKENEQFWTDTLSAKLASGETPTDAEKTRYRHSQIKKSLIKETFGKCAYCESRILHISFGDVEHIAPKSRAPEKIFRWENLTLACDRCNTYKADYEEVIDPYHDNLAESFVFLGPAVIASPICDKAVFSERCLKLNRGELMERRVEKIKYLSDQLMILLAAKTPELKAVLKQDLISNETDSAQEYCAISRSFLDLMLPKMGL